MEAPGSYKPLVRRLRVNLEAAHWLIGGVFIAASSGDGLLFERAPGSPWHSPLMGVEFVATLLVVVEGLITVPSWLGFKAIRSRSNSDEHALLFLLFLAWVVLVVISKHARTSIAAGLITALFIWTIGRIHERLYSAAATGWLLAGFIGWHLHWPKGQAFLLAMLVSGLATAVQGVWEMPQWHEKLSQAPKTQFAPPNHKSRR